MIENGGYIVVGEDRFNKISTELMEAYCLLEVIRDMGTGLTKDDTLQALRILHEALYRIYALIFIQDKYLEFDLRAYNADCKFEQFMKGMLGGPETII